jgi:hypothetical protein
VAAHPIDHGEQHRLIRGGYRNPVLILIAMADETDIGGIDLQ